MLRLSLVVLVAQAGKQYLVRYLPWPEVLGGLVAMAHPDLVALAGHLAGKPGVTPRYLEPRGMGALVDPGHLAQVAAEVEQGRGLEPLRLDLLLSALGPAGLGAAETIARFPGDLAVPDCLECPESLSLNGKSTQCH